MILIFRQSGKVGAPVLKYKLKYLLVGLGGENAVALGLFQNDLKVVIVNAFPEEKKKLPHMEIAEVIEIFSTVAKR